jgi:hypothetical protein
VNPEGSGGGEANGRGLKPFTLCQG